MFPVSQGYPSLIGLMTAETADMYIRQRESTQPVTVDLPKFQILKGRRQGTKYAVFKDGYSLFEFGLLMPWVFDNCPIVSFGEYENAFDITHWGPN